MRFGANQDSTKCSWMLAEAISVELDKSQSQLVAVRRAMQNSALGEGIVEGRLRPVLGVQHFRQQNLLAMVTITEAFLDAIHLLLMEHLLDPRTLRRRQILNELSIAGTRTWEERCRYFLDLHGVNLRAAAGWQDLRAAQETRNSIAHGLGRLTAQQLSNRKAVGRLASLGVNLNDGRIHIPHATLEAVATAATSFIRHVGGELLDRGETSQRVSI